MVINSGHGNTSDGVQVEVCGVLQPTYCVSGADLREGPIEIGPLFAGNLKKLYEKDTETFGAQITPRGETPILTRAGMLVVPLSGETIRFWYRLGCSKQNTYICIQHGTF